MIFLAVFVLALFLVDVTAHSSGSIGAVCETMVPNHGVTAETNVTAYTISVSNSTYTPNQQLTVTLSSTAGQQFKGFLIQARSNVSTYTTYGSFDYPNGTHNPCSLQNAVSHTNADLKTTLEVTWTAPSTDMGDIVFVYTVVETKATYWVKLESDPITFDGSTEAPTQNSTPSTQQATQSSTPQPRTSSTSIDRDAACEVTKSCFPSPAECSTDCNYLITWSMAGADDVEFTLKRKTSNNDDYYIAIGFSDDAKMGNDSVVHCVIQNSNVEVMASFNPSVYNERLSDIKFGISQDSGSIVNGILSCTFRRKLNSVLASAASSGRRRRAVSDGTTFFDLNTSWHLFVAHGSASTGYLIVHVETPVISTSKINFLQMLIHPNVTTETPTGTITKDSGCGSTVGCFSDCGSGSCDFILTWRDSADSVNLTLSCKESGNSYCAIGLSDDDKMGDDFVFECVSTAASAVSVQQSYNDGRINSPLDNEQLGLSVISTNYAGGIISCAFSRKKNFALATTAGSGNRKKRTVASSSTYFDMNNDYTLMFARGQAIGGSIQKHSSLPSVSNQKADFQSVKDLSSVESSRTLIKLHGTFMSVSWMILATLGIFMARFYKPLWTGPDEDCCGLKRWFVVHRTCMVLVFLLTSVSFVIIFVHVEGYSEIVGDSFEKSHPILGIVVMALTVINPLMALFRPNPGSPKRTYFNIGHTFVGWSAHICGIVNLFSGTMLSAANVDSAVRYILWSFVGLVLFVTIVCQIYDSIVNNSLKSKVSDGSGATPNTTVGFKSSDYELDQIDAPSKEEQNKSPSQTFKSYLLCVHVLLLFALSIAVVVLIWMA